MVISTSVADSPVASTPQYCTVAEVADILQVPQPTDAADEGEPTSTQWGNRIRRMEEHVDRSINYSYRTRRVLLEYHDWTTWITEEGFFMVQLDHRPALTLSVASGDAFEAWSGGAWIDVLATLTEGRQNDYWLQEPEAFLRFRRTTLPWSDDARVRVSYRYGSSVVPEDIRHATALLTAASISGPGRVARGGRGSGVDAVSQDSLVDGWRREAYLILANHQRVGRGY